MKDSLDDRKKLGNVFKVFLSFHHLQYIRVEEWVPRGGISREKKNQISRFASQPAERAQAL